ncbi:MAG: DUF4097 family beta strand repeat-containing protein [Acidobacteriota bacterium]
MLKRLATLLLGIGLVGLGVLVFLAPEQAYIVRVLTRGWPVFLILAGVVRVAGYLIDRTPRSPVGGCLLTAMGGILLAANLRGELSFFSLLGKYWFWLLLAYIAGRVLRQYTHRPADGLRTQAFSPGAIALMVLLFGSGLAANYVTKNSQSLNGWNLRLGQFSVVGDYLFGDPIAVEDEAAQTFALKAGTRLLLNNFKGDLEVSTAAQSQASARLIKRIRATNEEEAKQVAQNIHLQINPGENSLQFSLQTNDVQKDFLTTLILTLPENNQANIEVTGLTGSAKFNHLRGDHNLREVGTVEITQNTGRIQVDGAHGTVELAQINGPVSLSNLNKQTTLREITGALTLTAQGIAVSGEKLNGPVQVHLSQGRLELSEISGPQNNAQPLVKLDDITASRVTLSNIQGSVVVNAERSRIEAEDISGDFTVKSSAERVIARQIGGALRIHAENGAVEVEEVSGATIIEATQDVSIRDFRGPLNVTSQAGTISLATEEKLGGNLTAINERGRIRLSLPEDSSFKLDADTERGRLRLRGFDHLETQRQQRHIQTEYNPAANAPVIVLRTTSGNIELQASGLALASNDDDRP